MTIWDLCIRRPIFTLMLVAVPIVLGVTAYNRLGVELFPNVDLPMVTVTTTLRGAGVEEMETSVTRVIEEAVNTASGIDELRSTTREGFSQVVIQFKLEKNGAVAAQEVDAKVRTILGRLPEGTDAPIIDKLAIDAAPVMTIAVSGRRDFREVTEITRKRIKEDLETLSGVGSVVLVGGRRRAIQVIIEPEKLLKYENLTIEEVRQGLVRENQEQPGGRVDRGQSELVMRTLGRVEKPGDFAGLIVGNRGGQPIRIEDVGRIEDSYEEPRGLSRLWVRGSMEDDAPAENSVSLIIQKQSGSNTVEVVETVKRRLEQLTGSLPPDVRTEIIRDQSRFIINSMEEVKTHLLLAAILVSASILLFLRDWRTTIIATLSIPTSLVGTFAFMLAMGFTINNFTMLGLILAVGIVVDDAVVVHENIFRHMEERGLSAREAASTATSEIAMAVIATTLSLVVIFAPIAFMGGQVGRFLSCFGWVVGFAVLMSLFVSFTMTPMLCSRFLKADSGHNTSKSGLIWRLIEGGYAGILGWSLRHRWVVVVLALGVLFSTPLLFGIVGKDFVPRDDQSEFEVAVTLPEGYSLARAENVFSEIERKVRGVRGVSATFVVIGDTTGRIAKGQGDVTKGTIYCRMVDIRQRKFSQFDAMADARAVLEDYPDLRTAVQDVSAIQASGFREVDIDLNLCGPEMEKLQAYAEQVAGWLRERGGYVDVDTSLLLRKPELRIRPDRERLSDLGVSLNSVATTTNVLVGGVPVGKYKEKAEQFDVWLRAERIDRADHESIARMGVLATSAPGGVARLGSVARLEYAMGPNAIDRFGRQRQVVISANLQGKDMSRAVEELTVYMKDLNLPSEYRFEFIGRAKMLAESNSNFMIGFLLAFVFMYMILAAQFESLIHPISILAALPLTIPFAVLSLILLNTSLDIFAMLGLFMLFGIVKKNGILQVDYTNQLRNQGRERETAILEANRARLRPILMTTVMLVAAMIPMALGNGPGAGTRASMAKVILGGQALSLLLTLLVTPVAYSLFDSVGAWFGWKHESHVSPVETTEHVPGPDLALVSPSPSTHIVA
jgi:hydrophobic/amphiphilic exporter-1 (mainly G- bacteria), HAE1 family